MHVTGNNDKILNSIEEFNNNDERITHEKNINCYRSYGRFKWPIGG